MPCVAVLLFAIAPPTVDGGPDAVPPVPAVVDDGREARLAAGEIIIDSEAVEGSGMPRVTLRAVIAAPPAVVWAIVDRCGDYKLRLPRVADSEELSRHGTTVQCRHVLQMPWPFSNLTAINRAEHVPGPPVWRRTWEIERGDYTRNAGTWTLTAFGSGAASTLLVYAIHAEPAVSLPSFVLSSAQHSGRPAFVARLREEAALEAKRALRDQKAPATLTPAPEATILQAPGVTAAPASP